MKKPILVLTTFALAIFMAACGEAPKKEGDKKEENKEMTDDHAGHDHANMEKDAESGMLPVPEGAKVYFENLQDGQEVKSPVELIFGVEGMVVEPAGDLNEGKGHHHIIIDGKPLKRGVVVPADSTNIHYGKGQTETELELPKGEHTLTLQFADGYHQSYGEQMSATVIVEVVE